MLQGRPDDLSSLGEGRFHHASAAFENFELARDRAGEADRVGWTEGGRFDVLVGLGEGSPLSLNLVTSPANVSKRKGEKQEGRTYEGWEISWGGR